MLEQPAFLLVWQCGLLDHRRLGIDCLADRLAQHRNDLGFSSIPGIALQTLADHLGRHARVSSVAGCKLRRVPPACEVGGVGNYVVGGSRAGVPPSAYSRP